MDYLITGGAGFIGSHLADLLIGRGDSVTIVDNLSTGSIRNVAHLRQQPGFRYYIDDAANRGLMGELVDEADANFHLAAAVGVELIVKDPVHTIQTNIRCTEVVLELAPGAAWAIEEYPVVSVRPGRQGWRKVTLRVAGKPWLERLLLRLGPDARVVKGDPGTAPDAASRILARYDG
ncbi:MAG: GDP-mannose 4,6-dehydratase [Actinobacteria bacterium]|nr:GDP-mannose 4,6-dehydratase [Actinomycetota bacterium]